MCENDFYRVCSNWDAFCERFSHNFISRLVFFATTWLRFIRNEMESGCRAKCCMMQSSCCCFCYCWTLCCILLCVYAGERVCVCACACTLCLLWVMWTLINVYTSVHVCVCIELLAKRTWGLLDVVKEYRSTIEQMSLKYIHIGNIKYSSHCTHTHILPHTHTHTNTAKRANLLCPIHVKWM